MRPALQAARLPLGWVVVGVVLLLTNGLEADVKLGGPDLIGTLMALVSGITYMLAAQKAAKFHDPETPKAELGKLRDDANNLVLVSGTFATVAVGTGAAAFVIGGEF